MKKVLVLLSTLALVFSLACGTAFAADGDGSSSPDSSGSAPGSQTPADQSASGAGAEGTDESATTIGDPDTPKSATDASDAETTSIGDEDTPKSTTTTKTVSASKKSPKTGIEITLAGGGTAILIMGAGIALLKLRRRIEE